MATATITYAELQALLGGEPSIPVYKVVETKKHLISYLPAGVFTEEQIAQHADSLRASAGYAMVETVLVTDYPCDIVWVGH